MLLLLETLKNSITDRTAPQIVPSMVTLFAARSLSILLRPDSPLYPHVNRYLLSSPFLNLEEIPLFYTTMFSSNSARDQAKKECDWILNLLLHGLKTDLDYKLCQRRHVVDILLGYLSSPLSTTQQRVAILEVCLDFPYP